MVVAEASEFIPDIVSRSLLKIDIVARLTAPRESRGRPEEVFRLPCDNLGYRELYQDFALH
jgi:hypothetical protein